MMIYQLIIAIQLIAGATFSPGKEYTASMFGARSDGRTMNTGSIQKGIDFIHESGGGTLVFYTGRYLTGGIRLRSNVSIRLEDGAVLVGSASPYDYNSSSGTRAIISADGQDNIRISGNGVIDGNAALLNTDMNQLQSKGYLTDSLAIKPALLGFSNCNNVTIEFLNLWNAAGPAQLYQHCTDITIRKVSIKNNLSTEAVNIFSDSKKVRLLGSYIESQGIALKWNGLNSEISIENTTDGNGQPIIYKMQ